MGVVWHLNRFAVGFDWVEATFRGPSPLSRRTIWKRLGRPPRAVMSAILHSMLHNDFLRRVDPLEVGSNAESLHVYQIVKD